MSFDLEREETWEGAMEGVTHLFSSTQDKFIKEHMKFASFCKDKTSLEHVVRISCFGADDSITSKYDPKVHVSKDDAEIPLMLQHYWWSERCFLEAGFDDGRFTSIRGNFYMNHLLKNEIDSITESREFTSPLGSCKNSFVSCNDMGEAAVTCLVEGKERHGNKVYDITGPESHSMSDVASVLSVALKSPQAKDVDAVRQRDLLNKTVTYVPQDIEAFEKDFGSVRAEFFEYLRNGFYSRCSPDFYNLTGRRPTTYYEYLTENGAAGDNGLGELFSSQGAIFTKGEDLFKDLKEVRG